MTIFHSHGGSWFSSRLPGFFASGLLFFLVSATVFAQNEQNASVIHTDIPQNMVVGRDYNVKISVKNTGTDSWTRDRGYELALVDEDSNRWETSSLKLGGSQRVSPGETYQFEGKITAPSRSGIYSMTWQMTQNGAAFGARTESIEVVVETLANRGKFISQVVPQNMQSGKNYNIVIQYKNVGNAAWVRSDDYKLSLKDSKTKRQWSVPDIELDENTVVPPGEIASFRFTLTAPKTPGQYSLQWRMLRGKNGWFGDPTPLLRVNVQEGVPDFNAEFVFQDIPNIQRSTEYFTILSQGDVFPVTLTFKNNGTQAWRSRDIKLVSLEQNSEFIWSIAQVEMRPNETVLPGEIKSFNFKAIAPLEPGIYNFQWQLQKNGKELIGEPTDKVVITVK